MSTFFELFLITAMVSCFGMLCLCVFMLHRNKRVGEGRREIIEFVFDDPLDWKNRLQWMEKELQSYEEWMAVKNALRPLPSFVVGRYADEFWQWREQRASKTKLSETVH